MGVVPATINDYIKQLLQLQPPGNYWPTDPNSNWVALLTAIAHTFTQIDNSAVGLVDEAFPDTTDQLLPNWMAVVGLPDECSTGTETEDELRGEVLAKLFGRGGQSIAYLEGIAHALGFTSTITDASIFMADISHAGDPLFSDIWDFVFLVSTTPTPSDTAAFECRINQLKPAHTTGVFTYP